MQLDVAPGKLHSPQTTPNLRDTYQTTRITRGNNAEDTKSPDYTLITKGQQRLWQRPTKISQKLPGGPMLQLRSIWSPVPTLSFKLHGASFTGGCTVVDKPGDVTYKIQLIGGTQTFVVHKNRLKPCHTPAFDVNRKAHPVSHEYVSPPTAYPVEMSQE